MIRELWDTDGDDVVDYNEFVDGLVQKVSNKRRRVQDGPVYESDGPRDNFFNIIREARQQVNDGVQRQAQEIRDTLNG